MSPFPLSLGGLTLVIVKPDEGVSTREAYAGVRPRVPSVPACRAPAASRRGVAGGRDQRFRTAYLRRASRHPRIQAELTRCWCPLRFDVGQRLCSFRAVRPSRKSRELAVADSLHLFVVGVARSWADVIPALAGALPGWPCAQAASGFHPAFAGTFAAFADRCIRRSVPAAFAVRASHLFCLRGLCPYRIRCPARLSGLHLWVRAWHLSASHLCCPHSFLIRRRFPIGYFSAAPPQGTAIFSMRCWWRPPSNCAAK